MPLQLRLMILTGDKILDMHDYQTTFLRLALKHGVLKFGEFKLKSGRISPYFFNLGLISSGAALRELVPACASLECITFEFLDSVALRCRPGTLPGAAHRSGAGRWLHARCA